MPRPLHFVDRDLIEAIAARAAGLDLHDALGRPLGWVTVRDAVTRAHTGDCRLRLLHLLESDHRDFCHDVAGIASRIGTDSWLADGWRPHAIRRGDDFAERLHHAVQERGEDPQKECCR